MNNKKGQTQEPVGGMKWVKASEIVPEKIGYYNARNGTAKVPCILHFGFDGKYRNEEGYAVVNIDLYEWLDENYTPPPAQVGIDEMAEELWDEFSEMIDSDISDLEYFAGRCVITEPSFKKLIEKIKAGYSASLPQSSAEEVNKKMKEAIETLLTAIEFVSFEHSAVYAIQTQDIIMLKDAVASLPSSSVTGEEDKDFIIQGLEEGSELWKAEYDNCRAILTELVYLKKLKDSAGKTEEYEQRQPLVWITAKKFLEKYQHQ